jgi:phage/plasmid-like protein (TIGR03299 family)
MAHLIDNTTGRDAIAFVGETPWHGLGQRLSAGADLETWRREAGLDWSVERAALMFQRGEDSPLHPVSGGHALVRSDTGAELGIVGSRYKVVQPGEVLDFFGKLAEAGGFTLETAGSLLDGKRIWGLARVNDGAPVVGHDQVRPYVLLATSFDGSMSTTAKFTAVRVVCNNTLTMAAGASMANGSRQTERDTTEGPVVQCVRVPHMTKFKADEVRQRLGIVVNAWDRWLVEARLMAQVDVTEAQADALVADVLLSSQSLPPGKALPDVRRSKAYKRVMELFDGKLIGANLCGKGNAWSLLNSVTEFVDHERRKTNSTRLDSAWFGSGEAIKLNAWKALREMCAKAGASVSETAPSAVAVTLNLAAAAAAAEPAPEQATVEAPVPELATAGAAEEQAPVQAVSAEPVQLAAEDAAQPEQAPTPEVAQAVQQAVAKAARSSSTKARKGAAAAPAAEAAPVKVPAKRGAKKTA